jgi:hypothetical protein
VQVILLIVTLLFLLSIGVVSAKKVKSICDSPYYVKHLQMAGGDIARCPDCHNGEKADTPPLLKGKYANMGGPNHGCSDCHNGEKAPLLPLPWGATSCADCHPMK